MNTIRRGDIFYINRGGTESRGSEQHADRPGVIVSNDKNNEYSDTVEVVYMTTKPKRHYPTHCTILSSGRKSTVLCEQIHTVAVERIGRYIGRCTKKEIRRIDAGLVASIGLNEYAEDER